MALGVGLVFGGRGAWGNTQKGSATLRQRVSLRVSSTARRCNEVSEANRQRRSTRNVFHNLSMSVFFSRPQEVNDEIVYRCRCVEIKVERVSDRRDGNASAGLRNLRHSIAAARCESAQAPNIALQRLGKEVSFGTRRKIEHQEGQQLPDPASTPLELEKASSNSNQFAFSKTAD
ncbi:hypothetical protein F5888DRAFT_1639658 [Russula emetica]|nr:hypothetical protein F5888DRAFT_1639658 [Russula emetica]